MEERAIQLEETTHKQEAEDEALSDNPTLERDQPERIKVRAEVRGGAVGGNGSWHP
jgi:hypothetical protein